MSFIVFDALPGFLFIGSHDHTQTGSVRNHIFIHQVFHGVKAADPDIPVEALAGNVVEDERVWGCTEWGIGYVSPIDAPPCGQDAKSHTDGICLNSTVWLDGRQIMKEGQVVDPELAALSPIK